MRDLIFYENDVGISKMRKEGDRRMDRWHIDLDAEDLGLVQHAFLIRQYLKISEYVVRSEYRNVGRHGRGNLCEVFFFFSFHFSSLIIPMSICRYQVSILDINTQRRWKAPGNYRQMDAIISQPQLFLGLCLPLLLLLSSSSFLFPLLITSVVQPGEFFDPNLPSLAYALRA